MATAPQPLTLADLAAGDTSIVLQRGDNDKSGTWGAQQRSAMSGQPVLELQQLLVTLGAMSATPDGDFGRKTQDAVKRFQWYLGRIGVRLAVSVGSDQTHGSLETFTPPNGVQLDGFVRHATLMELLAWRQGGYVLTSPLVRLDLGALPQTGLGPGFDVLDYPSPGSAEILVHQDFVDTVKTLDSEAKTAEVSLRINQAFRAQNLPVSGAVVPPATNSQHLIGHAVDLNIVDDGTVNTSAMFLAGTQTQAAKDFVQAAKAAGLRWGGDFSPRDPIHFDDFVPPDSDDYGNAFYFAQRAYAAQHPLRVA